MCIYVDLTLCNTIITEYRLFYRALLKKRPTNEATPYFYHVLQRRQRVNFLESLHATECTMYLGQHAATHCNTLQHTATRCNTLQHAATRCNTLQHAATYLTTPVLHAFRQACSCFPSSLHLCTNTQQHAATHSNTLQHTATRCNILQHAATYCNTLQHTATHCTFIACFAISFMFPALSRKNHHQTTAELTRSQLCCSVLQHVV